MHLVVIAGKRLRQVAAVLVAGDLRTVEPCLDFYVAVHVFPEAKAHADVVYLEEFCNDSLDDVADVVVAFLVGRKDVEGVCVCTAGDGVHGGEFILERATDFCKQTVAKVPAAELVHQVELFDVKYYCVAGNVPAPQFYLADVFKEVVLGVETRNMVALRLTDNVLVFEEFDDSFAAGEHHFGHVEGLRDKVGGAQLETADFGFLFGGHHDDRNALECFGSFSFF